MIESWNGLVESKLNAVKIKWLSGWKFIFLTM